MVEGERTAPAIAANASAAMRVNCMMKLVGWMVVW